MESTYTVTGMTCGHCVGHITEEMKTVGDKLGLTVEELAKKTTVDIETAIQMEAACRAALPADAAVMVAAVADWRPEAAAELKVKKSGGGATVRLVENPDILAGLSKKGPNRPKLVVGFAAETHEVARFAAEKLMAKGCDWIVANDVGARDGSAPQVGGVFGADDNHVTLVTRKGAEPWEAASKRDVARKLVQRIAEALK